jgi:hypothetical protein
MVDGEGASAIFSFWAHPVVEKNAQLKAAKKRRGRELGFI